MTGFIACGDFFVFAKKKIKIEKKNFNVHIFNKFKHALNKTSQCH